jgi:two-component system, cell cycle response regulator
VKILVADDDAISRCVMERTLRRAGYDVVLAENGRDALETLVSANAPRLALLDWMMPGLDGPAVCLEVRSHRERPYSYIALLTSKGAKEDLIAGLEAGADDYLTKPCHPEELKARLRTGERILRLEDTLVDAREEMRYKATHDALTSLWNRAAILAHLNNEIHRVRQDAKISLLLCDVDHFKRINDVHGHLVGDLVLQEIALRLVSAIRPGDAVGRLGGEEFLVILTDCGEESLYHRGEQLRQSVASSSFAANSQDIFVSVSIGAMTIQPGSRGQKVEVFLNQADTALYRAKLEGRNRVIVAEPQLPPGIPLIEKPQALVERRVWPSFG